MTDPICPIIVLYMCILLRETIPSLLHSFPVKINLDTGKPYSNFGTSQIEEKNSQTIISDVVKNGGKREFSLTVSQTSPGF